MTEKLYPPIHPGETLQEDILTISMRLSFGRQAITAKLSRAT